MVYGSYFCGSYVHVFSDFIFKFYIVCGFTRLYKTLLDARLYVYTYIYIYTHTHTLTTLTYLCRNPNSHTVVMRPCWSILSQEQPVYAFVHST